MTKVFLDCNDVWKSINSNTSIYGNNGTEIVSVFPDVTGLVLNSLIEEVEFSCSQSDVEFTQSGNQIIISTAGTEVEILRIPIQQDGTRFTFTQSSVLITIDSTGMKIDGTNINQSQADTLASRAEMFSVTEPGITSMLSESDAEVTWLDSGSSWSKSILHYQFPQSIPAEYTDNDSNNWQPLNTQEQTAVITALDSIAHSVDFTFVAGAASSELRYNVVTTDSSISGYAYYPSSNSLGGDVFLSEAMCTQADSFQPNGRGPQTILHETGHALGLKHPFEDGAIAPPEYDNTHYTLMSYTYAPDLIPHFDYSVTGSQNHVSVDWEYVYRFDMGILDIAALQALYAPNLSDTTDSHLELEPPSADTWIYYSLWDAGGHDHLNFDSQTYQCIIDLNPGTLSSIGYKSREFQVDETVEWYADNGISGTWVEDFVQDVFSSNQERIYTGANNFGIAFGTVIEDLSTGAGDDMIYDNYVDNQIFTGAGDDCIYAGSGGFDFIDGGSGYDTIDLDISMSECDTGMEGAQFFCVSDSFALQLSGIEKINFTDTSLELA